MTNEQKQKIQLRVSEIKQMLNRGDGPPGPFIGKQPPEVEALLTELKDLEWQLAADEHNRTQKQDCP